MLRFDSNNRHRVQYCPCGKSNADGKFVPFVGYDKFGHCYSCLRTIFPEKGIRMGGTEKVILPPKTEPLDSFDTISYQAVEDSMSNYSRNAFYLFLMKLVGESEATNIAHLYRLGTTKFWGGSTVFWQIDQNNLVRSGKIIQYKIRPDETSYIKLNCKRVKDNKPAVKWVHKVPKNVDYKLKQCFFGEHLLSSDRSKPVAMVESEKTAVIAATYFPGFIWLATGSLGGLKRENCMVLNGRKVILFPDLNGYEPWTEKSNEIAKVVYPGSVQISDFMLKHASPEDKTSGADIADLLIRLDPKRFQKK